MNSLHEPDYLVWPWLDCFWLNVIQNCRDYTHRNSRHRHGLKSEASILNWVIDFQGWCRWFATGSGAFGEVLSIASLVLFYMPWLWSVAKHVVHSVGLNSDNEIWVTIAFYFLDSWKDTILSIPFSLYSTFVIEQRWGILFYCSTILRSYECFYCWQGFVQDNSVIDLMASYCCTDLS